MWKLLSFMAKEHLFSPDKGQYPRLLGIILRALILFSSKENHGKEDATPCLCADTFHLSFMEV